MFPQWYVTLVWPGRNVIKTFPLIHFANANLSQPFPSHLFPPSTLSLIYSLIGLNRSLTDPVLSCNMLISTHLPGTRSKCNFRPLLFVNHILPTLDDRCADQSSHNLLISWYLGLHTWAHYDTTFISATTLVCFLTTVITWCDGPTIH